MDEKIVEDKREQERVSFVMDKETYGKLVRLKEVFRQPTISSTIRVIIEDEWVRSGGE
jgi:hypothetical protein